MPFEKGKSGNPGGRNKSKPWSDALRLAASRQDGDETKLHKIAAKTVEMAIEGDMAAIKEIGDRLEGKAAQTTDLTVTDNRTTREMTDAELLAIASGSSTGDAEKEKSPSKSGRLH